MNTAVVHIAPATRRHDWQPGQEPGSAGLRALDYFEEIEI